MTFITTIFYLFAITLVFSALRVITASNPVQSALFLVLAFFTSSAIWMLLNAEFLAIMLVLVYVGAVMVLFLFVVMMVDFNTEALRRDLRKYMPSATLVGVLMITETVLILLHSYSGINRPIAELSQDPSNTHALGVLIYTKYLFPFEIAGLILLVAVIAAVALTLRQRKDRKTIRISEQLNANARDRVRLVSMPAEMISKVGASADSPLADEEKNTTR